MNNTNENNTCDKKTVTESKPVKSLLKNEKTVKLIVFGGFALIILVFLSDMFAGITGGGGSSAGRTGDNAESLSAYAEYEARLEAKLERAISAIDGVGELTIVVSIDSLSETVYAERGGGVRTVVAPRVRGVAVICDGGGDAVIRQKIVELVSRVLGISSTRISVTN